jgi:exonuclease III
MTDHGTFVLFNVYAPNGMHPNKMKFLHALQKSMRDQRENYGKHVVLVGDMNLKIHKRDICWRHRVLNVDQLLLLLQHQQQDNNGVQYSNAPMPKWKTDVYTHWDKITTVLETIEAVPCQTTNPNTKQTFDRWRARVKLADEKYIILGTYEESAEDALFQYSFAELAYNNEGDESIDGINNADTRIICRKKNVVSIEVLSELMSKIVNVSWDVKTQREIADSDEADLNPDNPAYVWMKGLLDEDGMVDVFRHLYPDAEGRFTVWHQQKNRRYVNEGTRIDFTLVDNALLDHVDTSGNLRCGTKNHDNPFGEEAALLACTSNGLFQAPSFAGGGIAQVSKRALDSQFGPPHTGMIYTPPSYSDHIAISLLMKRSFDDVVGQLTLQSNAATRKSQPHKKQQSIASFLCVPGAKKKTAPSNSSSFASASASSSTTAAGQKRSAQQQKQEEDSKASKSNDLKSFFGGVVDKKLSSSFKNSSAKPAGSCINNNGSQGSKKQKKNSLFNHFSKK